MKLSAHDPADPWTRDDVEWECLIATNRALLRDSELTDREQHVANMAFLAMEGDLSARQYIAHCQAV